MNDTTYQESLAAYTSQLRHLFAPDSETEVKSARRGGARVDAENLVARAENLAHIGLALGQQHVTYLATGQPDVAQAAELKLLAQANAELQVASALLQSAEDELRGKKSGIRRSGSTAARALDELADIMSAPLQQGLEPFMPKKAYRGAKSSSLEESRQALKDQVRRSLVSIGKDSAAASSRALDTLLSLDSELLEKGVSLISKEIAEAIDKIAAELAATVKKLLKTAVRLILQAYDWVLSLIGKDTEKQARKKVQEWIEELRKEHQNEDDVPGLAEQLVHMVFATETIKAELDARIDQSQQSPDEFDETTGKVNQLSKGFQLKVQRVEEMLKVIGTTRGFIRAGAVKFAPLASALPYIELLVAGVMLGLMGYTLFTGYDHVDSGKATFFKRFAVNIPDRVEGVRETVNMGLALPA